VLLFRRTPQFITLIALASMPTASRISLLPPSLNLLLEVTRIMCLALTSLVLHEHRLFFLFTWYIVS
jgi:hypothetical protein